MILKAFKYELDILYLECIRLRGANRDRRMLREWLATPRGYKVGHSRYYKEIL